MAIVKPVILEDGQLKTAGVGDQVPQAYVQGLDTSLGTKVDKVSGKGLSDTNFTQVEKTKLSDVAVGATKNRADTLNADKTTQVIAGTGLTGGGTLAANRTLTVTYGTAAGTAAQGNDSRITGALQTSQVVQVTGTSTTSVMSQKASTDQLATKANTTIQMIAGTGLTGGGTLAANRTLAVSYGTTAGTAAQGNDSRIVNAVPNSRTITAGTGLTGGGTLAANRTLAVSYGTTAGTAAQGNDSRLSNSREWTASTVSQTEAQAGTATTARKWTAQRVAQAISALGLKIGTTATTAKAGNWMPTWANVTGKPTTFTPAAHNHSAGEITSGVLAYARIPTIRHGDTDFANQALNTGSSVQHATVRTGGTVDDGTNSLQVAGGTRTNTLAAGGVQAAEESIDTGGNIQVRGEGQLKMGDFAIQYNAATQSLDFNFVGN